MTNYINIKLAKNWGKKGTPHTLIFFVKFGKQRELGIQIIIIHFRYSEIFLKSIEQLKNILRYVKIHILSKMSFKFFLYLKTPKIYNYDIVDQTKIKFLYD